MRTIRGSISVGLSALMLTAGSLQGCSSYQSRPLEPASFNQGAPPQQVRVTLVSGRKVELQSPFLSGDSLIGIVRRAELNKSKLERLAFPIDQIREVAVQHFSAGKTVLLVVGIGVAAIVLLAVSYANSSSGYGSGPECTEPSCPFIYSWDGTSWRLDSGTFGGAIMRSLARTDVDNLDFATSKNGILKLKLANELDETDYVDALEVLAADHDPDVTVAPDGDGKLHTIERPRLPAYARDFRGRDALPRVRAADGWSWESNPTGRDPAVVADIRDGLELAFARPGAARSARLVVDGNNTVWAAHLLKEFLEAHGRTTSAWYDSMEANPERARALGASLAREAFLTVRVKTTEGWERQGLFWEVGPEIVKRQVMVLDLSRCEGDTVRVRLESIPCFWQLDQVALDVSPERPVAVTALPVDRAIDHNGKDVAPRLTAIDGSVLAMETGDFAELVFRTPAIPSGRSRSYLVRSHGWYHVHTVETGEPDLAVLESVSWRPQAASRIAVTHANRAMQLMEAAR